MGRPAATAEIGVGNRAWEALALFQERPDEVRPDQLGNDIAHGNHNPGDAGGVQSGVDDLKHGAALCGMARARSSICCG